MNRTTTLVLAILCAIVAAFIALFEKDWHTTEQARQSAHHLYDAQAARIDWIFIKNTHDRMVLRKADGRWRLAEPGDHPADRERVEDLLRDLQRLDHVRQFHVENPAKDLEPDGLAPPAIVMRARWNGEEIELRLGARTPMGNSVYAQTRKNEDRVYAISADLLDKLSRRPVEWRSRRLVEVDLERVEEIRLSDASLKVRIERRGGHWFLKSPLKARASGARVRALLAALDRARTERFVTDSDERLEDFGLKEPRFSLHLDVRDDEDIEVLFGAPDPENPAALFARRLDTAAIVTVSTNVHTALAVDADSLRDRQILPLDIESVERVVLTSASERLDAVRESERWHLIPSAELETQPANAKAVAAFLRECASLNASAFLADAVTDPAALGIDKPRATVEFWTRVAGQAAEGLKKDSAGRCLAATLLVGSPRDGIRPCVVEPEPFVVAIPEKQLAFLDIPPWQWRALDIWNPSPGAPKAFSVQRQTTPLRLSHTAGLWRTTPPADIDQAAAESVFQLLCSLRAARWLGPDAKVDRQKPQIRFQLHDDEGPSLLIWFQDRRWIGLAQGAGAPALFFELAPPEGTLLDQPLLRPAPDKVDKARAR